jgi:hypothetical protein
MDTGAGILAFEGALNKFSMGVLVFD